MTFNNSNRRKRFEKQQEQQKRYYISLGMSEEAAKAMYEYDLDRFNSQRREIEHAVDPSDLLAFDPETNDSRYMEMDDFPANEPIIRHSDRYAWIDELANPELHRVICSMSPDYIEIITMLMDGFQQNEIAQKMNSSFRAINNKITRIKNKLIIFC